MITVKEVTSDEEYAACLEIRRQVFIEEQGVSFEEEVDAYEKESTHFLAYCDEKPASTGRFRIKKEFLKFERVATLAAFRGKGLARAVMLEMQRVGQEKYPQFLPAMHAQAEVISFYEKLGWVGVGERFMEANIEHLVMVLLPKDLKNLKCLHDPETPKPILDFLTQKMREKGES